MGYMDKAKDITGDTMNDTEKKAKIEQIAKDKGISIDKAKEHFMKKNDK